jgi:hypothetical protein
MAFTLSIDLQSQRVRFVLNGKALSFDGVKRNLLEGD